MFRWSVDSSSKFAPPPPPPPPPPPLVTRDQRKTASWARPKPKAFIIVSSSRTHFCIHTHLHIHTRPHIHTHTHTHTLHPSTSCPSTCGKYGVHGSSVTPRKKLKRQASHTLRGSWAKRHARNNKKRAGQRIFLKKDSKSAFFASKKDRFENFRLRLARRFIVCERKLTQNQFQDFFYLLKSVTLTHTHTNGGVPVRASRDALGFFKSVTTRVVVSDTKWRGSVTWYYWAPYDRAICILCGLRSFRPLFISTLLKPGSSSSYT